MIQTVGQFVDDVGSNGLLALLVEVFLAAGREDADLVLVRLETRAFVAQRVEHYEVEVLLLQLLLGVDLLVVGLKCKADEQLAVWADRANVQLITVKSKPSAETR